MNFEDLIIEKLNDIKEDQKNLRDDFKELKHDLNHRMDNLEDSTKELKDDLNHRIGHVEDDLANIKDNHLTHIHKDLSFVKGCLYFVTPAVVGILLKIIFWG
ncbi:MAG: hypothetical protein LBB45_03430 [Methanobrevibacter sp.]|nr:hypothetical protein [Candidatus Methanovirga basalitermitum]